MPKTLKLALDILIGAVAPVVILKYGTAPLGTLNAYLLAAFVPVVWVMLDLFVITRRFNFITTFVGLSAVMRGALAFWYVDGALFAFKDSTSYLLSFFVFGVTALIGIPVTRSIALQGLGPDTPEREKQMDRLLDEPTVRTVMKRAGLLIGVTNLGAGAVNYVINFRMVVAPFNTPAFNDQVANVNAITRLVLVLPDMIAIFFAFSMMYKAMYALLPADEGTGRDAGEFWTLLARRDDALALAKAGNSSGAALGGDDAQQRAARQAREDFGLS
ncbi:VC0807 family protein [Gemmatimonas sp.]|uniref:VC0807 family protein n=1 Tax=Gemmatimonas sp. TaxID=1962908 RepID=UPI00356A0787